MSHCTVTSYMTKALAMHCNANVSLYHWVRKLNNIAITLNWQSIFNPFTYFDNTLVHYRVFNNYCRKILAY